MVCSPQLPEREDRNAFRVKGRTTMWTYAAVAWQQVLCKSHGQIIKIAVNLTKFPSILSLAYFCRSSLVIVMSFFKSTLHRKKSGPFYDTVAFVTVKQLDVKKAELQVEHLHRKRSS